MNGIVTTARVDTTNLMRANAILMRHSKRSPARCVNSTAYHVIKDVVDGGGFDVPFPVTSQARIDSDMQVTSTPILSTRGPRAGLPLKSGAVDIDVPNASAAMMIVVARMHPNSKYSLMTGNRWGITPPDFGRGRGKGGRRVANQYGGDSTLLFWAWVKEVAERMVRARHSSTGFLKKSWIDLKVALLPFAMGNSNPFGGSGMNTRYADISPAKEGSGVAVCRVSNTLGASYETTPELSEKYNEANHRIAEPRLRNAINREFQKKMELAESKEWAKTEPELKVLGLLVKP